MTGPNIKSAAAGLWLVLLLAVSGCATGYEAPAGSDRENATLVSLAPVWVISIDGKSVSHTGVTGEKDFGVSPGAHTVVVKYSGSTGQLYITPNGRLNDRVVLNTQSLNDVPVKFVAVAGHTYYMKDGFADYEWRPHVSENRDPVFQDVKAP